MRKSKLPPSNSRLSWPKPYLAIPKFLFMPDPDFENKAAIDILSKAGFRTLCFLFSQYNGRNNGDFSIAPAICAKYGRSRTTARKGVAELAYLGLVVETRRGGLNHPSLYGVTWLGLDEEVSHKPGRVRCAHADQVRVTRTPYATRSRIKRGEIRPSHLSSRLWIPQGSGRRL